MASPSRTDLLSRIETLELENRILRESIEQQQSQNSDKIYFDGFRTRCLNDVNDDDNEDEQSTDLVRDVSQRSAQSASSLSVGFRLDDPNRFSLQRDFNDMTIEDEAAAAAEAEHEESNAIDVREDRERLTQSMPVGLNTLDRSDSFLLEDRYTFTHNLSEREVRSDTVSRAVELGRTLKVLNKMLAPKRSIKSFDSMQEERKEAFQQFYLLSVDMQMMNSNNTDWVESGYTYLDPVAFKSANCLDKFPNGSTGGLSVEELSMFCFLDGVNVRLIPRVVENRLGWMDEMDYKVLVVSMN